LVACGFNPHHLDTFKDGYLDSRKSNRAYDGIGVATDKRSYKRVSELPIGIVEQWQLCGSETIVFRRNKLLLKPSYL
jgi:hypothetical protein